jgi:hypothetical protein
VKTASDHSASERTYWSENYATRPYIDANEGYEDYAPAFSYGVVWYQLNPERHFDEFEADLAIGWESARGASSLDWLKAKPAVRDAWYRVRDLGARAQLERADVLSTSLDPQTPGDH